VSVEEVMDWADSSISAQDDPSLELIELSLSGGRAKSDVLSCLAALPGTPTPNLVASMAFEIMHRALSARRDRLRRVTRLLERMYWDEVCPDGPTASEMCLFDDAVLLAEGVAGKVEDVYSEVLEFLLLAGADGAA
jgi:hypothetical protein